MAQMKNQYNFGIFSVNMEEKISTSGTHVVGNLPIESILRVYRAWKLVWDYRENCFDNILNKWNNYLNPQQEKHELKDFL